jgi:hypothetical protein
VVEEHRRKSRKNLWMEDRDRGLRVSNDSYLCRTILHILVFQRD